MRRLGRLLARDLGAAGLALAAFSLVSAAFGLVILIQEKDRLRRSGRDALRPVIAGWARTLPVDYVGATLADYAERWRAAPEAEKARRFDDLALALQRLGGRFDQPEMSRTQLVEIIRLDLADASRPGASLASWGPRQTSRRPGPNDLFDRLPIPSLGGAPSPLQLVARYRFVPELERTADAFEDRGRRIALALLGLSLFPLLSLVYLLMQARALRERAAREASQAATLDLADRTCHELGNVAFVLANERRNLTDHLDQVSAFLDAEPAALDQAMRRAGLDEETSGRVRAELHRLRRRAGLDPETDLRPGLAMAGDVCEQVAVCADFIGLTVRELDGYLKQTTMPIRLEPLELRPCVRDALALLSPRLGSHGVTADADGVPEGLRAIADRRLLLHAIVNLIKNAIESVGTGDGAARREGRVTIAAAATGRGLDASRVVLEIADNGPGLAPEVRDRLFDDGVSTKGDGRGRGLAIVADSVLRQHGRIEVVEGRGGAPGVTFRIILPAARESGRAGSRSGPA
jgi:signal transduction histidine kinase